VTVDPLIPILADGEFHSGESLGLALGISRAAVWKRLQRLASLGIAVQSHKGRGYRVPGGLCLLDAAWIEAALVPDARALLARLVCLDDIGSTNEYLLSSTALSGDVCLAERQSAGRGRRGRTWLSPYGRNMYLSLRWQYEQGVTALEGLSLAVGVIVAEVLAQEFEVVGVTLKWPNDLLLHGRKLGGVLVEVGGDLTGDCAVVVGIGLNVSLGNEAEVIDQPWTDLVREGVSVDRNHLCARMISRLLPVLATFPQRRFATYRERWLAHAAFIDQPIILTTPVSTVAGTLRGVDGGGGLVVDMEGQLHIFSGGEISVRSA
jgi:BirA family transcriptional regulator, biotin operon repressor / biotin---[acetyl-CoA-carboxylase] ligase